MTPQQLKNAILHLAITGKLLDQNERRNFSKENAADLLNAIQQEKETRIKEKKLKKTKPLSPITDEEKPFEIPENWVWVRLGDLVELIRGKGIKRSDMKDEGFPCIRYGELYTTYSLKTRKVYSFIDEVLFNSSKIASKGDVLLTLTGENKPDIGKAILYYGEARVAISSDMAMLKVGNINGLFLTYLLNSSYAIAYKSRVSTGNIIVHLSNEKINNFPIPLPPLAEQKAIVEKLDKILPAVETYTEKYQALKQLDNGIADKLKKSLLQQAVTGKLLTETERRNFAKENAVDLLNAIQQEKETLIKEKKLKKTKPLSPITDEEKPFEIPENWVWVRLGDIVNFKMGKTPPRKEDIYWSNPTVSWISIRDIKDGTYINKTAEQINDYAVSTIFKDNLSLKGTLIMSFKLSVGKVAILDMDAVHNEAIVSIYPVIDENNKLRNYLFTFLPLLSKLGETKKAIKGYTLNSDSLNNLLIPLPSLAEQKAIVEKLDKLLPNVERLQGVLE